MNILFGFALRSSSVIDLLSSVGSTSFVPENALNPNTSKLSGMNPLLPSPLLSAGIPLLYPDSRHEYIACPASVLLFMMSCASSMHSVMFHSSTDLNSAAGVTDVVENALYAVSRIASITRVFPLDFGAMSARYGHVWKSSTIHDAITHRQSVSYSGSCSTRHSLKNVPNSSNSSVSVHSIGFPGRGHIGFCRCVGPLSSMVFFRPHPVFGHVCGFFFSPYLFCVSFAWVPHTLHS